MRNDDDLFVLIIGDESEIKENNKFEALEIKQEIVGEAEITVKVERLLDTAIEHGEVFEVDGENLKLIGDTPNSQSSINIKSEGNAEEYGGSNKDYVPSDVNLCDDHVDYITSESNADEYDRSKEDYEPSDLNQCDDDIDYIPSDHSLAASSDGDLIDTNDKNCSARSTKENAQQKNNTTTRDSKNTHFWKSKPRKIISHVKRLQSQYPELKKDDKELINRLVEIMKQTHRPDPPKDYYVMNGIMLECVHCAALSATIPAAHKHYQEKHGERYLYCFACGADFRSTSTLYKHEKRCEAPDIKIVLKARAIWLGRKGRSRPFIPDFSKLPPKRYHCTECSANFASKYDLLAHERMHRGERPFRCTHCPRAYTSNATLSRHMQKHGSQEYVCDHCGRSFKVRATFVVHMDTHAPLKKYPCLECHKRYSQKTALQVHVHRDHRRLPLPFACQICPKRYPRMSGLKEHTKKVHGLLILTPKLFSKQLPVLRDTQLQQAKVVLKSTNPAEPFVAADKLTDHHDDDC